MASDMPQTKISWFIGLWQSDSGFYRRMKEINR
jgi:hypothetical protein